MHNVQPKPVACRFDDAMRRWIDANPRTDGVDAWAFAGLRREADLLCYSGAPVVKLVDTQDLKSCAFAGVPVRFRPGAQADRQ